ncbi:TGL5 [Candida pseudojiufengensis]|uniref:TGL5 n=1 Tax=Candida pseudojiufengensis TaxID=497109 RepID=UPI0022249472|nr:TGL5 [Candida pseudojiufengensis]KAI5959091.1 TGL5 [Candida pseudojiufengensis]
MDSELKIISPINSATNALITSPSVDTVIHQLFDQYIEIHPKNNQYVLKSSSSSSSSSADNEENGEEKLRIKSWFNLRTMPIIGRFLPEIDEKTKIVNELLEFQKSTRNYKDWVECSLKLDELLGNNTWKSDPQSDIYDYNLIYNHLTLMKNARLNNNFKLLLYYIRTNWVRNLGNMGDSNLYRHSYVGTKKLIEEYLVECQLSLNYLVENNNEDPKNRLNDRYLLGMLIQTRKNIGRTALVLSGGSTFGIFHIGVLATLFEANLLPRIISGSSAGSIVASILCCHTNEETIELLKTIAQRNFNIFDITERDSNENGSKTGFKSILMYLGHLIKYGTIFDIEGLQETMIGFLGDLTFREAYNRTGKILNITVSPASLHEQTRLLNYITAPNCLIWSAVCASSSLPGVFPSSSVYEKNTKTNEIHEWNNDESMKFVDGSVDNDLPITRLSEMFNVDHIIAVQVNPHVVPVLKISVSNIGGEVENELSYKLKHLLNNVYDFVSSEAIHYLQLMSELDISKNLSNKIISILSQNYSGDITILPEYKVTDFTKLFENPNPDFLLDFICRGAKASWPKISIIHNHCSVEFALDKAITILRGRIITSSNNRITQSGEDSSIKRSQSYYRPKQFLNTLNTTNNVTVNSPPQIENSHNTAPNTPIKTYQKRPQGVQRHNTTSNTTSSHKRGSNSIRSKRNSMSATESESVSVDLKNHLSGATTPKKGNIPKGISSTALAQMNNFYVDEKGSRQKIRKTRSSGNFENNLGGGHNKNNKDLIIGSSETSNSNTNSSKSISKNDKANLPSSRSRSLKNSYIGLNRLNNNYDQQDLITKLENIESKNNKKKSILKNSNFKANGDTNQIQFYDNSEDDETAGNLYYDSTEEDEEEEEKSSSNDDTKKDDLEEPNLKNDEVTTVTFESIKMEPCTNSLVDDINEYHGN